MLIHVDAPPVILTPLRVNPAALLLLAQWRRRKRSRFDSLSRQAEVPSRDTGRTTSQENIDAIKRGIEAFNRGDWDAALERLAEDVVWTPFFSEVDGGKSIYGRADLKRAWQAQREVFGGDAYEAEGLEFRDLGAGTVLVTVRLTGRGTASGVDLEAEIAQVWTFRRGLGVRVDQYGDVTEALEAVGLPE